MKFSTALKLTRISAWPTLLSNVLTAWWLVGGTNAPLRLLPLLLLTGSCFYLAGMVLNDVFDARLDARERPERPIPSGEVSIYRAGLLGFLLLFTGLMGVEACVTDTGSTLLRYVGWLLAAFIVGYDAVLKRIPLLGPLAMGYCRFFNILFVIVAVNAVVSLPELVHSDGPPPTWEDELTLLSWQFFYAFGILLYIFGVTLISTFEAGLPPEQALDEKRRFVVWIAAGFAVLGLLFLFAPILGEKATGNFWLFMNFSPLSDVTVSEQLNFSDSPWGVFPTFLFAALPFALLWKPILGLFRNTTPETARRFVGSGLALLIPIDAVCCLVYVGIPPALSVLCLYPLARSLRRIVPMS